MRAVVISSFVAHNNKAPVGFDAKYLRLCCQAYDEVYFLTANYPAQALNFEGSEKVRLVNLYPDWPCAGLRELFRFAAMQMKMLPLLRKLCKKGEPDTAFMFWLAGPMILPFVYLKARKERILAFLYGNTKYKSECPSPYHNVVSFLTGTIARHADRIGVESASVLEQWNLCPADSRVRVIHLFGDGERFRVKTEYRFREKAVGFAGRLIPNKKILQVIEAFAGTQAAFPDHRLLIAGSGDLEEQCRELICRLGQQKRIEMLGWVDHESLPDFFNRLRLLVFPSNYEGLPNVVIESLCCGTPVLASPVGGIPDVIREGETGFILDRTGPEDIRARLTQILGEPEKLEQLSRNAADFAGDEYSYETSLAKFMTCAEEFNQIKK